MPQTEAEGRLNLYDDVTPLENTKNISVLTKAIRKKTRGADVREAIAKAIETTYADGATNGNTNMEVIKARGLAGNLDDRLSTIENTLSGKASADFVEKKFNKIESNAPKAVLNSLSEISSTYPNGANGIVVAKDTGKWYYYDEGARSWKEGGVYQSRGLGGNEVTADNIDFAQGIKQMLTDRITGTFWVENGGKIINDNNNDWSRYLPVNLYKGKTYYIVGVRGVLSYVTSVDGSRIIKKLANSDVVTSTEYTPSEDAILYISTRNSDAKPKVFNASVAEIAAANVDMNNLPDGYISLKIPKLSVDVKATDLDFVTEIKQLIDENTLTRGKYYNGTAKQMGDSKDWGAYPPFYLEKGKKYGLKDVRGFFTYYFSLDDRRLKQFSSNDNLISEDFTPTENGYLLITRRLAENPSKLIQGGLGAASKLPNLNYGASALESNTPIAFPKLKNEYTIKKSAGDFSTLTEAIKAVGAGNADDPVTLYIHSGEYDILQELGGDAFLRSVESNGSERQGIEVPDYVNIIGVGDVRLKMEIPDNKTTWATSSRTSVLNVWRHNTIKNIKITVRNTRYAVHDETNNQYSNNDMKYIDCYFEHQGNKNGVWSSTQAYAAGMGSGGSYHFENCTFKSTTLPFSMHDNFNVESNRVKISKCTFITGSGEESIRFGSYGTGAKKSIVTIENCNIDKAVKLFEEQSNSRHGNHFAVSGGGNTIVPYININSTGRKERVEFADEVRTLKNTSQTRITVGMPVELVGNSVQPLGTDEPWRFYGVSLDDIEPNAMGVIKYAGYVAKDDTGISSLTMGQRIGLVDGRLAAVNSNDFIGYATDGNNILLK
jgi:possible minor tail protein|nr:MAG TPA: Pectinesterase [Caudoviricetes sp.]